MQPLDSIIAARALRACLAAALVLVTPFGAAAPTPARSEAGAALTTVRIQNTGAAQASVPFTFGQAIAPGDLRPGQGLAGRLPDGTLVPLQTDIKATHADGSARHAIVSGVLPALAPRQAQALALVKAAAPVARAVTPRDLAAAGLKGKVTVVIEGVKYSASLADALATPKPPAWLAGPVVSEWLLDAPLKDAAGKRHPLLTVRFDVRWYPALERQARIDVIVENNKTFAANARNLVYDVEVDIGGRIDYARIGLTHYHHARWRHTAWWDASRAPAIHLQPDTGYLIATRAVPNFDRNVVPDEGMLADLAKRLAAGEAGPMTIGPLTAYMPTAGGRGDIGPLPGFSVQYLLSMDARARASMMAAADGSGSWSIHYRDENTDLPLRVDSAANRRISTHGNLAGRGPLPVPRCDPREGACKTPYSADASHQPSLAYLPYLLTGDYYYLEELQFWAASNPLATDPDNSGQGQGLLRWQQVRGQAWSLRTLGHAAYITPDAHPLKAYFTKQVDNNLAYYQATLVDANPNRLGLYDGTGERAFKVKGSAPWQDDFLTWSFGHLAELGFTRAEPILRWKARYPIGRMTAPGYCWIQGAAYSLQFRENKDAPAVETFAQLYAANFSGDRIQVDGKNVAHPQGARYIDQPCDSQAQVDWISAALKRGWKRGRMTGYATSALGYPANMQPALALAVTYGVPDAARAWAVFTGRADQPNYGAAPQWAIVPRPQAANNAVNSAAKSAANKE